MLPIEIVNLTVAKFCENVVNEPLCYFSEADMQVVLSGMLREQFSKLHRTSVKCGPRNDERSKATYRTTLVHNEYGAEKKRRMDIAILDHKDVKVISDSRLRMDSKYLKPRFGIELGTEFVTDTAKHLKDDVSKLRDQITECGYVIHFYRDVTLADNGTLRRETKEKRLSENFRQHFEDALVPDNIRVLAFLIRTGRSNKRVRGKCELLDVGCKNWRRINLRNVANKVVEHLKGGQTQVCLPRRPNLT